MDAGERSAPGPGRAPRRPGRGDHERAGPAHAPRRAPALPVGADPDGHPAHGVPASGSTDPADPAFEWSGRQQYQLHSMQLGAADVALGRVMDHLEATGVWDDTTFVVVSDHGISLLPPDFGRERTPNNEQELFRTAMFVKGAGQQKGEVRDEPAQSIDLLPDADRSAGHRDQLGLRRALAARRERTGDRATRGPRRRTTARRGARPRRRVPRRLRLDGAGRGRYPRRPGGPPAGVALGGAPQRRSPGSPTTRSRSPTCRRRRAGRPSCSRAWWPARTTLDRPSWSSSSTAPWRGSAGGYLPVSGAWRFTAFLGPYLRDGANQIDAYEVVDGPQGPELRPVG